MHFKEDIAARIQKITDLDLSQIESLIEIPPQASLGDFAFPCFPLAKALRKAPPVIAQDLAQKILPDEKIEKVQAVGGYVNIFLKRSEFLNTVIGEILEKGSTYGSSSVGKGKKVLIEYSSPNIAKEFHVGHLMTTMMGHAINAIYRHLGFETVRLNHIGDWETQFGKFIAGYTRWADEEAIKQDPIKELTRVYVKFHEESEKDPSLIEEGRSYFKKLEEGEPVTQALWRKFRDLSLEVFGKQYAYLGVEFDSYAGESFYGDKIPEVVQILREKNLLKESEGALVVDLEHLNLPPCIIIKSDGTSIYGTRDLAAAIYRKRTYGFDKCLYIVGTTQALHFKQIFETLRLAGFDWSKDCIHIGTPLVKLPGNKSMSTRKGDVIGMKEIIDESVTKTEAIIAEKNPELANRSGVAKQVGLGAVFYSFLKTSRKTDVVFSWEDALNFEGDSGPYLQYCHARGKSILRKAGPFAKGSDFSALDSEEEFALVKLLSQFEDIVIEAAEIYEPSTVSKYLANLAKSFNKFYNTHHILNAEPTIKEARLNLTSAVCTVMATGLGLLGIAAPESM